MLGNNIIKFNYPYEKIADDTFYAKFSYLDQEYRTLLHLKDADWSKPVLFGCERFKGLLSQSKGAETKLIKYLINVNDPGIAFLFIMQFIHQFGTLPSNSASSFSANADLLEEIREIGFEKVIDTNDDFSRIKLKLTKEENMSLRLFKDHLEYSLDSRKSFPLRKVYDKRRGFLDRIIKAGLDDLKELDRLYHRLFEKLDEEFPTLQPERFDKTILLRKIHVNNDSNIIVHYDYESKQVVMNQCQYNLDEIDNLIRDLRSKTAIELNEESEKECGICYSTFLNGRLTDLTCGQCNQFYHESCLRDWFRANPTSRTIFEKIGGDCLFCEKEIFINNK